MTNLAEKLRARQDLAPPTTRRAVRIAAGATLEDVAAELGVSKQAISMWELGQREPRDQYVHAYAEVLRELAAVATGGPRVQEDA